MVVESSPAIGLGAEKFTDFSFEKMKRSARSIHYSTGVVRFCRSGGTAKMKLPRRSPLLERQLRAEVRRIQMLLERTRRTQKQVRLLIAIEKGVSRRRAGIRSGG
jgi:hypothetical protein